MPLIHQVGIKSRGVYETPGGTILRAAHLDLESLTLDREVLRVRDMMSLKFSEKVYEGFWFSPEMEFLQNAMDFSQRWAVVPRTEHFVDDT